MAQGGGGNGGSAALAVASAIAQNILASREQKRRSKFQRSLTRAALFDLTPENIQGKVRELFPDIFADELTAANLAGSAAAQDLAFRQSRAGTSFTGQGELSRALSLFAPSATASASALARAFRLSTALSRGQAGSFAGIALPEPRGGTDLSPLFGALEAFYLGRSRGGGTTPPSGATTIPASFLSP